MMLSCDDSKIRIVWSVLTTGVVRPKEMNLCSSPNAWRV